MEQFAIADAPFEEPRRTTFLQAFGWAVIDVGARVLALAFFIVRPIAKLCSFAILPSGWFFFHEHDLKLGFMFGIIFVACCAILAADHKFSEWRAQTYVR